MCPINLVEPPQQIFGGAIDIVAAAIIGEISPQWTSFQFAFEQVDLVQKKDYGCAHEPATVDYAVEKHQGFHHAILVGFFEEHLVVF